MNRAAAWVIAAVTTAGAAGVATGVAVCQTVHSASAIELQAADREMLERLRDDLELRGDQIELLRAILRTWRDDEAHVYRRNRSEFPAEVQKELTEAQRLADLRIQFMLDPRQRARYDDKMWATPGTKR